ncbi:MAG: hypothetical protein ACRERC_01040 [Candidatus Binatia bacterium]
MVPLDDQGSAAAPPGSPPISQERRNELNRALHFMLAKARCRGHALSCFLDEPPSPLIPRRAGQGHAAPAADRELLVNRSFLYAPRGGLPAALRTRVPPMDGLLSGSPLAWIEDAGTGVWAPYWARGEWLDILASLRPGQPAPAALPPVVRETLAAANVLVAPGGEEDRRATWQATCRDAEAQFQRYGYAIVRDLIPPVLIGALRHYYRGLVAGGQLPRGDDQVPDRYRLHSEPAAMFFHPQLAGLLSRIAAQPVRPSYLYFASYPPGAALPRHVDRAQCELSISLLIDYSPEPDGPCGWPLFLEHAALPGGLVAADLGIGDAVIYRGRELAHYRHRLPDGHQSSSLFFHYVGEDFAGDTF